MPALTVSYRRSGYKMRVVLAAAVRRAGLRVPATTRIQIRPIIQSGRRMQMANMATFRIPKAVNEPNVSLIL